MSKNESRDYHCVKCPNKEFALVRMGENTDQKKLLIWTLFTQYIGWILVRNNSFSTSEKFPEKQIFLTPWYTHVRVRIRGKKYEFLRKFCVCTKWIIPYSRTLIFICSCYKFQQRSITRFFCRVYGALQHIKQKPDKSQ